jgi:lysophospholipase L1-like esterase
LVLNLHSWPDQLARRLSATPGKVSYSVVNAGIGGNRLLVRDWGPAGLARLDRDALRIEGLSHLVLLEGTNDIGLSGVTAFGNNPDITSQELIAGYRQVTARAHARGVKVILGTLTPVGGAQWHSSPHKDAIHEQVNAWIRTSGEADGVIDFERMVRDPGNPTRFAAAFDSGDHLHPNDAGYKAMGDGIDLSLFR